MNIHPGSKVRILEDSIYPIDDIGIEIRYTKGSLGTVLSYEEYYAHAKRKDWSPDWVAYHLKSVKWKIDAGTGYPIRIDEYVPLPENEYASLKQGSEVVDVSCKVGCILILSPNLFVVI